MQPVTGVKYLTSQACVSMQAFLHNRKLFNSQFWYFCLWILSFDFFLLNRSLWLSQKCYFMLLYSIKWIILQEAWFVTLMKIILHVHNYLFFNQYKLNSVCKYCHNGWILINKYVFICLYLLSYGRLHFPYAKYNFTFFAWMKTILRRHNII